MDSDSKPGFIERLTSLLLREPEDRQQLMQILHAAYERNLMDADALTIIEGALSASETRVTDVMIPRAQMDVIDVDDPLDEIVPVVIETAHSRFPVVDGDRDNILGILLAKDLLRIHTEENFDLRDWLRPAVFIPESKRLNVLLREFRVSRNHMAIVVNEYGGVAGLVTIEDLLEQIVGEIDDEHDDAPTEDEHVEQTGQGRYEIEALMPIEEFNERFGAELSDEEYDTIGGLFTAALGHLPEVGEELELGGFHLRVLESDGRRLHTLELRLADAA